MPEIRMTDLETAAYLRDWVKSGHKDVWGWPTDGCGYDQHIRFVKHRNQNWHGGDFNQFVLDYADMLEREASNQHHERKGERDAQVSDTR